MQKIDYLISDNGVSFVYGFKDGKQDTPIVVSTTLKDALDLLTKDYPDYTEDALKLLEKKYLKPLEVKCLYCDAETLLMPNKSVPKGWRWTELPAGPFYVCPEHVEIIDE